MGLQQTAAGLSVGRLPSAAQATLPIAPYLHVFIAAGSAELRVDGQPYQLAEGDSARVSAAEHVQLTALSRVEVLVWEMHGSL